MTFLSLPPTLSLSLSLPFPRWSALILRIRSVVTYVFALCVFVNYARLVNCIRNGEETAEREKRLD